MTYNSGKTEQWKKKTISAQFALPIIITRKMLCCLIYMVNPKINWQQLSLYICNEFSSPSCYPMSLWLQKIQKMCIYIYKWQDMIKDSFAINCRCSKCGFLKLWHQETWLTSAMCSTSSLCSPSISGTSWSSRTSCIDCRARCASCNALASSPKGELGRNANWTRKTKLVVTPGKRIMTMKSWKSSKISKYPNVRRFLRCLF